MFIRDRCGRHAGLWGVRAEVERRGRTVQVKQSGSLAWVDQRRDREFWVYEMGTRFAELLGIYFLGVEILFNIVQSILTYCIIAM